MASLLNNCITNIFNYLTMQLSSSLSLSLIRYVLIFKGKTFKMTLK